jgi:hypothetical protein
MNFSATLRWVFVALVSAVVAFPLASSAQQFTGPTFSHEVRRGMSLPLRVIPVRADSRLMQNLSGDLAEEGDYPVDPDETRHPLPSDNAGMPYDPALQMDTPTTLNVTMGVSFNGVGAVDYSTSDVNGSVGATQYVQYTNWDFAIYNKTTGAKMYGPVAEKTLWAGFNGNCATSNSGDIIVLYDKKAQRWIFSHHALNTGGPFYQCFAISQSSDATGAYYLYQYQLTNDFPDYPKLGVWADGYYLTTNLENTSNYNWLATQVCAFDRAQMLTGASAQEVCFQTAQYPSLLPADIDGSTAPPSGSPELFLSLGSTGLDLFKLKVNWTSVSKSTFTGPTAINVAAFSEACGGEQCIPQLDTSQVLDSLGDRLMYRLAFRNFGTHASLVVTHSVVAGSSIGPRWYEIRNPFGTPVVYQQGTYAPDGNYRWMGSIAMDHSGDMALGYSISSANQHPGINFTGRLSTDALGTMESEMNVITGGGSEQSPNYRWGDYTSMSVDPVDDCTFWYTNQYYAKDSQQTWSTRVVSFKFPSCE